MCLVYRGRWMMVWCSLDGLFPLFPLFPEPTWSETVSSEWLIPISFLSASFWVRTNRITTQSIATRNLLFWRANAKNHIFLSFWNVLALDRLLIKDRHFKVRHEFYFIHCIVKASWPRSSEGSLQNKFSVKVGILAQGGGGGSDPIPTFFQNWPKPNLPWNCP